MARDRHIVALGGGGFWDPAFQPIDDFILALTGVSRPKVLFVPTAVGDDADMTVDFYAALSGRADTAHLPLFHRTATDLRSLVLEHDVVYVAGGNTANMLAVWRAHGLDAVLREAWQAGVVLCGWSAGAICWFEAGITDSFGPELAPLTNALGFLQGSFCPHYDGEEERRPTYHRLVADGFPSGIAADDRVAVHYAGTELREAVSPRPDAGAYRVALADGEVSETPLPVRRLS